jgi:rubrerythrin
MSLNFNAREIFDMGLQIEQNGKSFYEEAAKKSGGRAVRDLFTELAAWEGQHVALFQSLRDALPPDAGAVEIHDPTGEAEQYLRATADSHVFMKEIDVVGLVGECKDPFTILNLALTFEKDSVVFYITMKKVVPPELGHDKIEPLINEEIKHIGMLIDRQKKLALG